MPYVLGIIILVACVFGSIWIENNHLKEQNKKLMEHNEIITRENERLMEQNKELMERNETIAGENERLTGQNKELMEQNETITGENERLTEQNKELVEQNKTIAGENNRLTEQNRRLMERNETITGEKKRLTEQNKKLMERNETITGENKRLTKQNKKLMERNEPSTGQAKSLIDQKKDLHDRILYLIEERKQFENVVALQVKYVTEWITPIHKLEKHIFYVIRYCHLMRKFRRNDKDIRELRSLRDKIGYDLDKDDDEMIVSKAIKVIVNFNRECDKFLYVLTKMDISSMETLHDSTNTDKIKKMMDKFIKEVQEEVKAKHVYSDEGKTRPNNGALGTQSAMSKAFKAIRCFVLWLSNLIWL